MIPVFGTKQSNQTYESRFAAYIVIQDKKTGNIALMQAPNDAYFLPGGEIEIGETKEVAVRRETVEELGITVELAQYLGQADEYFFSRHRDTYYYNPGYFFVAKSFEKISDPTEKTSRYSWVTPLEAIELLKRGSHKWAVKAWLATL